MKKSFLKLLSRYKIYVLVLLLFFVRNVFAEWKYKTFDNTYDILGTAIAIDSKGYPHIVAADYVGNNTINFVYFYWNGMQWSELEVAGSINHPNVNSGDKVGVSLVIRKDGDKDIPCLVYGVNDVGTLRYIERGSNGWYDLGISFSGTMPDITVDNQSNVHIAYTSSDYANLNYVNAYGWSHTTVAYNDGQNPSIVIDKSNGRHIIARDSTTQDIFYSSGAVSESVAPVQWFHTIGGSQGKTSLAISGNNIWEQKLHAAYFKVTANSSQLYYSYKPLNSYWVTYGTILETINLAGGYIDSVDIACGYGDVAHIVYCGQSTYQSNYGALVLKYVKSSDLNDLSKVQYLDNTSGSGKFCSIAIDQINNPHIAYRSVEGKLKYVSVKTGPDLIISSVTLLNNKFTLKTGESIKFNFVSRNIGDTDVYSNINIEFVLSLSSNVASIYSSGVNRLSRIQLSGINAESSIEISTSVVIPIDFKTGDYYLGVVIDPEKIIGETNEDNNFGWLINKITIIPQSETLSNTKVYPSIAKVSQGDKINFDNVTPRATVTILSSSGVILKTIKADENGNVPPWDGRTEDGSYVPTGTYIVNISDSNSSKNLKIVLIR